MPPQGAEQDGLTSGAAAAAPGGTSPAARVAIKRQRIIGTRRRYNQWVNDQTLEDFALRFTARRARTRSAAWVANTALGSIAFLACEAIGATVTVAYGFDALAAALIVAVPLFLVFGLPICYYGARYGVDIDLLTRGAGFGYIGSTITSAIYASFTFILFAIEAVILSAALELCFGIPLAVGHILSALVIIPIAAYGFARISRWQNWTQPLWLVLQLAPLVWLLSLGAPALELWQGHEGRAGTPPLHGFAIALAVLLSLLPQIGEQVDYLRFLPEREQVGARRWWGALLLSGPGWIVPGTLKILIGSFLAVVALTAGLPGNQAVNPTQLYHMTFSGLIASPALAVVLTALFVALCQIKINVTNAYAGSIASSNFFSRLTHRHPGRVVWLVFNTLIALMLMQGGIQGVVERVLVLYSHFAVAWFGAVAADLMVSKPLGLSPKGIEFRRAYLHDFNPVGLGAMAGSLLASIPCLAGLLGSLAQALSPAIGLGVSFVLSPLIAWATGGRFYLARTPEPLGAGDHTCVVCRNRFEAPDMAGCPVYGGTICSLCCTLEARCHDACKEQPQSLARLASSVYRLAPLPLALGHYVRVLRVVIGLAAVSAVLAAVLLLIYHQRLAAGGDPAALRSILGSVFVWLVPAAGFAVWFFVLGRESHHAAEEESERQVRMLMDETAAHSRTHAELQRAKEAAEAANLAKTRYIVGISHEIRTPLNAISGYAQLIEREPERPAADAVRIIRRSATHLTDLVDGLVDVSRIESGSVTIARERVNLTELIAQIVDMFRIQAAVRGIEFEHTRADNLPELVYTDQKRLRQILINLISNAIKYTPMGIAALHVRWRNPMAEFVVEDTGVGIDLADIERIFKPFERLGTVRTQPGVGLGLTITRLLVTIMGGELTVESRPGLGSTFKVRMFFSEVRESDTPEQSAGLVPGRGLAGERVLVVDDDPVHLDLVRSALAPLGLDLAFADDGEAALATYRSHRPALVIMDVAMPGIDGWQAARALRREHGEEAAILMVSANVHDFQRGRRSDDPHDDFLVKPYELDALVERVALLLQPERHGA